ncbi:MAG: D-sedoheptulose 7-phosphate isomerase [Cyclobacteriaceae bacterium]
MDSQQIIKGELTQAASTLNNFLQSSSALTAIEEAASKMSAAIKSGNKIISCGNGGSHCDAMHFAEELSGRFRADRQALPALSISDPSHITCVGNDYGFEFIFSRYVEALGSKGDVLLAISTSGNSANVLNAAKAAKDKGITVVALSGNDGGKLKAMADVNINVPHNGFADRIQEMHIKIIHILILLIEKEVG